MMSEDEAAGLRKQLIRFHCISCDRPIDVQPHPFVLFIDCSHEFHSFYFLVNSQLNGNFFFPLILDNSRVFQQIRGCVLSSLPGHTQRTSWTRSVNIKRGFDLFLIDIHTRIDLCLVNSLATSLAAVWQMFMPLFDNVVVHIR